MSNAILKTRCNKGHIIVYEDRVTVEYNKLGFEKSQTLNREQITGVDVRTNIPSIMGLGGASDVTIHSTGDKSIETKMVKPKDAQKIRELLS